MILLFTLFVAHSWDNDIQVRHGMDMLYTSHNSQLKSSPWGTISDSVYPKRSPLLLTTTEYTCNLRNTVVCGSMIQGATKLFPDEHSMTFSQETSNNSHVVPSSCDSTPDNKRLSARYKFDLGRIKIRSRSVSQKSIDSGSLSQKSVGFADTVKVITYRTKSSSSNDSDTVFSRSSSRRSAWDSSESPVYDQPCKKHLRRLPGVVGSAEKPRKLSGCDLAPKMPIRS